MPTRVLIVANLPGLRADLRALLELSCFYVCGEAASSAEATRQAQALAPDVVLVDLEMPALEGYRAVRALKQAGAARAIVALSADGGPAVRAGAARAGADAFALKGADLPTLLDEIQAHSVTPKKV